MSELLKKRYPSKGEFPEKTAFYYVMPNDDYRNLPTAIYWYQNPDSEKLIKQKELFALKYEYWLEEIELPSDKEIEKALPNRWDDFGFGQRDGFKLATSWLKSKLGL